MNHFDGWPNKEIFSNKKFRDACHEAHNAVFWMSRGANSFLTSTPENSHLRLFWHKESSNFRTKRFESDFQIGLNLPDLELYFCENGEKVPHSFWLDEKTPAFIEAWYLVELLHRDLDQSKFSTNLPFESPAMLMGDTQDHNASDYQKELEALNQCFVKSVKLLEKISIARSQLRGLSFKQNEVVLEPETFTIELEIFSEEKTGRVIKIGFNVGDHLRPTPFLFVKDINQNQKSKNRSLDYLPESIHQLTAISEDGTSDEKLAKELFELAIAQT